LRGSGEDRRNREEGEEGLAWPEHHRGHLHSRVLGRTYQGVG
jgi:hypothetical protein